MKRDPSFARLGSVLRDRHERRWAELAVRRGLLSRERLDEAEREVEENGGSLETILKTRGWLDETTADVVERPRGIARAT